MTYSFVKSAFVLTLLFAIAVAVTGNRLYPKPELNGEQVEGSYTKADGHSVLKSALSLKKGPLTSTCSFDMEKVEYCDECDMKCKELVSQGYWGRCRDTWIFFTVCTCYYEC
ncbi:unnamed protein product [Microthlaspi erraticum]|uniref:Knottin scorpion toxin-like domain-containing protein n=1 Tax=Microthlaspi erraticum TaxID=1685480 RepID=A0A6D2KC16_9BRAS|nr:unnamed protein product [Microthlaspi erraticum]